MCPAVIINNMAFHHDCRGGAGISKVVRPLHIKDDLCMCKEAGGGGRSILTGNVQII